MTPSKGFDRTMSDWLDERAQPRAPDGLIEHTLERTQHTSPRPGWRIPAWWLGLPVRRTGLMAAVAVGAVALVALSLSLPWSTDAPLRTADGSLFVAPDDNGTHRSLVAAVEAAEDGDTIELAPGTYTEAVTIDKDLTLVGSGPAEEIVISVDEGPVMVIEGADVAMSGITFTGPASDGVRLVGGTAILEDLVFRNVGEPFTQAPCPVPCWSLYVDAGASVVVSDNEFIDGGQISINNGSTAEIVGNSLSGGPHIALFEVGPGTVVRNNTITDSKSRGIGTYEPTDVVISGNTITNVPEYGITVGWGSSPGVNPQIVANTISGSGNGIDVAHSAEPLIERNVIFDNGVGIILRGSDAFIGGNDLGGNGQGIVLMGGAPEVDQNTVTDGAVGLAISSAATPVLTANTICDNDTNVSLTGDAELPATGDNQICEDESSD